MLHKLFIAMPLFFLLIIPAKADIFHTYGYGAKGISLGNALVAQVDSTAAVFYNPAGLGRMQGDALGFSYMYSEPSIDISFSESDTEPAVSNLSTGMITIDLGIDINRFFNLPVNTTFGLGFNISDDLTLMQLEDLEENNPRFLRYGAQIERTSLYAGIGFELLKNRIWIGGGGHAIINGDVAANITVEPESLSTTDPIKPDKQDVWVEMKGSMSPTAGIIVSPLRDLLFGFSFKEELDITVDPVFLNLDIPLGSGHVLPTVTTALSSYYIPRTYRLGASYTFRNITTEIAYSKELWSGFKYSSLREERRVIQSFNNTNIYHFGLQIDNIWILTLRGGYQFAKTPVPDDQYGESNLFDSDRHIFSFGTVFEFKDPLDILKKPVLLELGLQKQMITGNSFTKHSGEVITFEGDSLMFVLSITFKSDFKTSENLKDENKNLKDEHKENDQV